MSDHEFSKLDALMNKNTPPLLMAAPLPLTAPRKVSWLSSSIAVCALAIFISISVVKKEATRLESARYLEETLSWDPTQDELPFDLIVND